MEVDVVDGGHALVLEDLHEIAVDADGADGLFLIEVAAGLDAVGLTEIVQLLDKVGGEEMRAKPE